MEAMASPKMGCPEVGGPVGGLGSAEDAPEWARGGGQRPAVRVNRGRGARVVVRPNRWKHEHH